MSPVGHSVQTLASSKKFNAFAEPLNEIIQTVQRVHDQVCE